VRSSGTCSVFQAAYARRGIKLELGERLALGYQFHIASSREQAIREAAPHDEKNMKMFGEMHRRPEAAWGFAPKPPV
jgi:hypothetical protein